MGNHKMQHLPCWATSLHCVSSSPHPDFEQPPARRDREPKTTTRQDRIMAYNCTAEWIKGAQNHAPDALSRNPVSDPQPHDVLTELDIHNSPKPSIAEVRAAGQESIRIQDLQKHAKDNPEYQQLRRIVSKGFPSHHNHLPEVIRRYWNVRHQLTLEDDLVVYGCCLLIPTTM